MSTQQQFFEEIAATQMIWALHDKETDGWVIVDSVQFEDTDVMLLWSRESIAQSNCTDEWAQYVPTQISVAEWLEFWVEDLATDNVMIGLDWQEDGECPEMELVEFSQKIAEIEKL
ncbi:DUF2750 domain-containing protein [Psychrosphaera ytuae]|uniref:DUF2750 domain-containing protein n=1 Tax=Psychrosphaera ytuae TaxID=2820710 RepID=A0A975DDJ4_9GAMM|nr:DUF2750 domain-containing protein [Psychrosphaera ytuae]QTH64984.1 DUF2750 domain-containing protein [Psychrosphaera ytuae]